MGSRSCLRPLDGDGCEPVLVIDHDADDAQQIGLIDRPVWEIACECRRGADERLVIANIDTGQHDLLCLRHMLMLVHNLIGQRTSGG